MYMSLSSLSLFPVNRQEPHRTPFPERLAVRLHQQMHQAHIWLGSIHRPMHGKRAQVASRVASIGKYANELFDYGQTGVVSVDGPVQREIAF